MTTTTLKSTRSIGLKDECWWSSRGQGWLCQHSEQRGCTWNRERNCQHLQHIPNRYGHHSKSYCLIYQREGESSQRSGVPDERKICIDLPGGISMTPCHENTILFHSSPVTPLSRYQSLGWLFQQTLRLSKALNLAMYMASETAEIQWHCQVLNG